MLPWRNDYAVGEVEPTQVGGRKSSLIPGKWGGNAGLAEPVDLDGKAA